MSDSIVKVLLTALCEMPPVVGYYTGMRRILRSKMEILYLHRDTADLERCTYSYREACSLPVCATYYYSINIVDLRTNDLCLTKIYTIINITIYIYLKILCG